MKRDRLKLSMIREHAYNKGRLGISFIKLKSQFLRTIKAELYRLNDNHRERIFLLLNPGEGDDKTANVFVNNSLS